LNPWLSGLLHVRVVVLAVGLRLLLSLPFGFMVMAWVHGFFGTSMAGAEFAAHFDPLLWAEWLLGTGDILPVIGVGAAASALAGVPLAWFLDGVTFRAVARDQALSFRSHLGDGCNLFFRMARLSLFALPAHCVAFGAVGAAGLWAVKRWTEDMPSEALPLFARLGVCVVAGALGAGSLAVHGLARAELAAGETDRARAAYGRAWVRGLRSPWPWVSTLAFGAGALLFGAITSLADVRWARTGTGAFVAGAALQQLAALGRAYLGIAWAAQLTHLAGRGPGSAATET
jgi:hypothetical protein